MTPKKLFDVILSDTRLSSNREPDDQGNPTKLDFTDAYEEIDIQPDPNEEKLIISSVKDHLHIL